MYIRESRYAGDYHELFFFGKTLSYYGAVETRPFGVEFDLNYAGQEDQAAATKDIAASFTIPAKTEGGAKQQKFLYFKIIKDPVGQFSTQLDGRTEKVYTGTKFRLPTYVSDFSGNSVYFEATSDYINPNTKKNLEMVTVYSGTRTVQIPKSDIEALSFSDLQSQHYLENDRFLFFDNKKGMMLATCGDENPDDAVTEIKCTSIANIKPKSAENPKGFQGNQLIAVYPGKKLFYAVFIDTDDQNKGYLYVRDYNSALASDGKSYEIEEFVFKSGGIFIHNSIVYVYLVSQNQALNNAELKVINFEEKETLPEKDEIDVEDVFGLPTGQLCPYNLEFFPHKQPEFAIGSSCPGQGENDERLNRIFQFKIFVDKTTNKYNPNFVILTDTHTEARFSEPQFCLTDGYLHVFETKKQDVSSLSIMRSLAAHETDGSSIYIPIKEVSSKFDVTHVNSFYCDKQKDAVVLSINLKLSGTALTGIVTVDAN